MSWKKELALDIAIAAIFLGYDVIVDGLVSWTSLSVLGARTIVRCVIAFGVGILLVKAFRRFHIQRSERSTT
jgi:hypothetical protein